MAMLIGRERPAAVLRGEVERALASHGALVLVTGEAGIGKSALVASAAQEAVRGGARLLTGACWEGEGAPGYWPWVQVVRQLAPGATPQSLAGAEAEAFQLYDAVTALLVDASREQPVVVVLEDLHWADTASLRLLEFVVRHAWFERLLVIGTYRDAEVDGPLSLPLEAKATTLTLAGLDLGGVERLVALTTGVAPEAGLVAEIHQRTGGNPFFVEQTARLWQGGSPLATIPPGVGAAIRRRLSRLAGGVLDTLRMAAVLGREFTEESLVRALTHASSPVAGARRGSAVPGPGPAHGDGVTATAHAAAGGAAPELARTRPDDLMGARPRPDDLTGARPLSDGGSPPARRAVPPRSLPASSARRSTRPSRPSSSSRAAPDTTRSCTTWCARPSTPSSASRAGPPCTRPPWRRSTPRCPPSAPTTPTWPPCPARPICSWPRPATPRGGWRTRRRRATSAAPWISRRPPACAGGPPSGSTWAWRGTGQATPPRECAAWKRPSRSPTTSTTPTCWPSRP